MGKKEKTSKEGLFAVLDVLEALGIKYWVEGGWGVDILTGRQNREHRDIDIDFDGRQEALLLEELKKRAMSSQPTLVPSASNSITPNSVIWTFIHWS